MPLAPANGRTRPAGERQAGSYGGVARFIVGDALTVLQSLPDASVDLVLTSPPFLALRSYLPADHPDKAHEMGSEPTPGAFIDGLLDVVEECRRVLAPHGSLCFELGDTYAGSGGAGGDYNADGLREGQEKFDGAARRARKSPVWSDGKYSEEAQATRRYGSGRGEGWPLDKSLCLIPELFRISLVYGLNPLTGRETPRWRARNVIRWCRSNPPVGALADKVRPATSDMVVACTSRKRWFDLDAVRTEPKDGFLVKRSGELRRDGIPGRSDQCMNPITEDGRVNSNPHGAPPLDHWWHDDVFEQDAWLIPTEPYKGSHYATFPAALCVKPIEAMCPRRVCTVCGDPSRRMVDVRPSPIAPEDSVQRTADEVGRSSVRANGKTHIGIGRSETVGWTDCGHNAWRAGVVLDPFCGSGTTLAVATGHGRDAIGCDIDSRNGDLARQRVGMFLSVEHHAGDDR